MCLPVLQRTTFFNYEFNTYTPTQQMTNKQIAALFDELAKLMELYDENPFRIKSYQNVYLQLRKLSRSLSEMTQSEMEAIKGIGKGASTKIMEILSTGKLAALEELKAKTPDGIIEMLRIKGFGPKKIRQLWKELGIQSAGELWYACNENRLVALKGFGAKTQEDLKKKVEYLLQSKGKSHYAAVLPLAMEVMSYIQEKYKPAQIALVGEMARHALTVSRIEILLEVVDVNTLFNDDLVLTAQMNNTYEATYKDLPITLHTCTAQDFGSKKFRYTATKDFIHTFLAEAAVKNFKNIATEEEVFKKAEIPFIKSIWRDQPQTIQLAKDGKLPDELIEEKHIKGLVHCHSTYSDGIHTLKEMARYAQEQGFEYMLISDHSKSAFYANGLKTDRLYEQWAEIDSLNKKLAPFKIFKGIESDILSDGSLDYEVEILKLFDGIIASIHSNLKMDKDKATRRLIKAIENPYTRILGHPTGRLLLSRQGYPIGHKKVIDACAANEVAIELNANPYRLDLDYTWIPYAMEKGVLISINPDAHATGGIHDLHFGVLAAQKGRLTPEYCLNAKDKNEFADFLAIKK